ncbi:mannosyltransferase [Coemansia sp. Benny D160-2]|nr:mannosyltransferase [Coemansia sp. Benny D160-2]
MSGVQANSTSVKQARAERRHQKQARKAREQTEEKKRAVIKEQDLVLHKGGEGGPSIAANEGQEKVYVPSASVLFRILAVVRIAGALMAPIQDCDEVYNYWEPLHLLQFGSGKQTWEYAPQYALRSYGFLYVYKWAAQAMHLAIGFRTKPQVFYALRLAMALACAGCETLFVRRIADCVDRRIAALTALALAGSAGMFHAASALLPSSFAMCLCTLASAAAMRAPSDDAGHLARRVVPAVAAFVAAAAGGWPYAIIAAVPFALEEISIRGDNDNDGCCWRWRIRRIGWVAVTGFASLGAVAGAACAVDSWHYAQAAVVAAWNQVAYNVVGGGSQLYGTEPWHFYIKNGLANANAVMALALASLPVWAAYCCAATMRRSSTGPLAQLRSTHCWLLLFRILPFFLVFGVFSAQPHKEERFLTIVYPHMCFNAAVALALAQRLCAWTMVRAGIGAPTRTRVAARLGRLGVGVLALSAAVGVLRMAALASYYGAPVRAFALLHDADAKAGNGFLPLGPTVKALWSGGGAADTGGSGSPPATTTAVVCMGKDWYRFPSSYWLPSNHRLEYIPTRFFDGHLPGDFLPTSESGSVRASTSAARADFNAQNRWEPRHALSDNSTRTIARVCDAVVDAEYPGRGSDSHAVSDLLDPARWRRVGCVPMLDQERTPLLGRVVYIPRLVLRALGVRQQWGSMCVYRKEQPAEAV